MAVISEILRFILPRSSTKVSAFQALRRQVRERGSVKVQYFGYVMPNEGFPKPKKKDKMCWYIGTLELGRPSLYFQFFLSIPMLTAFEFKNGLRLQSFGTATSSTLS